jgi:hypothetical protein
MDIQTASGKVYTDTQEGDLISSFNFFKIRKVGLINLGNSLWYSLKWLKMGSSGELL